MRKTAIVTGAAQGIGRSIALRLAADGMNIILNDLPNKRHKLEEIASEISSTRQSKANSEGPFAHVVVGDVSESADVQSLIKETVSIFGALDVMVANAGIYIGHAIQDEVEADWDKLMSINLRGAMLCFKYAAQQMISQGKGGCIIAASSIAGRRGQAQGSAYCASKFAVRGLVHSSALDLGKYGIRVNAYAPGYIDTDMTRTALDLQKVDFEQAAAAASPLGHAGDTKDVSNLVSFLASSEASFITGQTYGVCGGFFLD